MTRERGKTRRQRGFTLIEVSVALAIVALALVAGAQASSALTLGAQRQGDMLLARLCAENALAAARLSRQMPAIGASENSCEQAGRAYTVQLQVSATPNPNFLRLDARVVPAEPEQAGGLLLIATVLGRY